MSDDFYFAFGANMNLDHMARLCPGARCIGTATLPYHRFHINRLGYATVVPDHGKSVHGVLWALDDAAHHALDKFEGVHDGEYYREMIRVSRPDGTAVKALIYLTLDPTRGVPRREYMEDIIYWADKHGLPPKYIAGLQKYLPREIA